MLNSIRYNLANIVQFKGREKRGQFWPYAAFVVILTTTMIMAVMLPEMMDSMARMQKFAAEHPELATVRSGPGSYSVSIQGNHPELMPNLAGIMTRMSIVFILAVTLLAAAVARRLHDRGRSGAWGLMPVPFLAFASVVMPKLFAQEQPDMQLFFVMFLNNLLYIASLIALVVLLAGASAKGENRYDSEITP